MAMKEFVEANWAKFREVADMYLSEDDLISLCETLSIKYDEVNDE